MTFGTMGGILRNANKNKVNVKEAEKRGPDSRLPRVSYQNSTHCFCFLEQVAPLAEF